MVDLPGYGFHKAGKGYEEKWADILENYILKSSMLKVCFLLLDIRHAPSLEDRQMIEFLSYNQIPYVIIATKSDKLSKSQINNAVLALAGETKLGRDNIIAVSSNKKTNLNKVCDMIERFVL